MNDFIDRYLKLTPQKTSMRLLFIYIFSAYSFGLLVRLILLYQVSSIESFWLNGDPVPIYSPDAGLYGYYAKKLLLGANYPMTSEFMPGYLIYWIVGIFSFNIDWVMLLLPAFLAPLIVIPVILMAQVYRQATLGFFAALIAAIGVNFYTRSYIGYMDTDTLNLFFPYMAIASFMMAVSRRNYSSFIWLVVGLISLGAFYFWYHSSLVIIAAILIMFLVVASVILRSKYIAVVSVLLVVISLFFISPEKISKRATDYINKSSTVVLQGKGETYHFVNTLKSVAEAQQVSIFSVNEHYIGMMPYVALATLGFVLLCIAQPLFLIALPMVVLAYAVSYAGMRFSMFATPIFALGFVGLMYILAKQKESYRYPAIALSLAGVALMIVNVLRVNPSFTPNYFLNSDVKALKDFAKKSKQKDLLVSWWDYGWPMWYYTGRNNTLIDNGRHGADTYLVSKLLLSKNDTFIANSLEYFADKQRGNSEILPSLIKSEDIKKTFETLKVNRPKRKKDRDIYFMLHRDMLLTFNTIEDFANIDINTAHKIRENSQLFISDLLRPYSKREPVVHGDTFDFDLRSGVIKGTDGASTQIRGVIIVDNFKVTAAKPYNPRSAMNLIIYNKTKAIYLENSAMNTFLIKALLLDQYSRERFEKVVQTDTFKIFKIR